MQHSPSKRHTALENNRDTIACENVSIYVGPSDEEQVLSFLSAAVRAVGEISLPTHFHVLQSVIVPAAELAALLKGVW